MNQFKIIYNDLTEEVCSVEVEFDIGPKKYALCQNSKKEFIPIALIDNKPSVVTNETELEAIKNVLDAFKNDIKEQELVDAWHEMWMAGASEVIYSMLMMKNNFIAPNINFENPEEDSAKLNIPNMRVDKVFDTFLSNSFGFGGTNSTLIVRNIK